MEAFVLEGIMTDEEVEKLIWKELKKRDVCFNDMIGMPGHGIDPDPKDKTEEKNQRVRQNRFTQTFGSERMKELLSMDKYNPYDQCPPLKIQFQDLFRFWWNNCVEKDLVFDEVLEDIYSYLTEQMRPPQEKKEQMDLTIDFEQLPLFGSNLVQAA